MSDPEPPADADGVGDADRAQGGAARREQDEDAIELRFFANFRQTVGQKSLYRAYDDADTIGGVLVGIEAEFPELAGLILDDDGRIQPQINVLRNGREVEHLEGLETPVEPGDAVSVFPPVAGG